MSTSLLGLAEPCNLLIYWLSIIYVRAGTSVGYFSLCFYINFLSCSLFFLLSVAIFHLQFVLTLIFEVPKIQQTQCQASIKKKKKANRELLYIFYDLEIS